MAAVSVSTETQPRRFPGNMWTHCICLTLLLLVGAVFCYPQTRVVNGTNTEIEKYPFMVSLRRSSGSHLCGASIVAPRWILTAAHCVSGRTPSQLNIQYAKTEINWQGNVADIKRILVHEEYNIAGSIQNDIALLELQGRLVYNYRTLAPVTLPESYFEIEQVPEGVPGSLIGWGANASIGGMYMNILQEVHLKIYSDEECNSRHNGVTTLDQICGGVDEGGKGQCNADSGGPLLYQGSVQLGIVSWSEKPCGIAPYPGVYTKVSHYISWIRKHIN